MKNKYINLKLLNDYIKKQNIKHRKRDMVYFRISLSYILYSEYNFKKIKIARLLKLDHSTIVYYINKFDDYIIYDDFVEIYQRVTNDFKNVIICNENNNNFSENDIIHNILFILNKHKKAKNNVNYLIKKYYYYEYINKHGNINYLKYYLNLDNMTDVNLILNKLNYIKDNNLFDF